LKTWLSLGSNLEDPFKQLERALNYLMEKCYIKVLSVSEAIATKPFGNINQPDFANQVVLIDTPLSAQELMTFLKAAEKHLGRVPGEKWGPRLIDLDILFYGDEVLDTEDLKIPHPAILQRDYLLKLLNTMIPEYIHPEENESINSIYCKFHKTGGAQ
jgi:2-amino-4-hydroxy-6-hydroxymethyldihydropteridine diphosphokinase